MMSIDSHGVRSSGALVIVLKPGCEIVYWNRTCSELTGRTLDEVRGRRFWELLSVPEEAVRVRALLGSFQASRRADGFESTWIAHTGERRVVAFSISAVVGADGSVQLVVLSGADLAHVIPGDPGLMRPRAMLDQAPEDFDHRGPPRVGVRVVDDITQESAVGENRRLWEERLSAVISIAADAIISTDDQQRIVVYNEGAQEIFGWLPEEVLGKPLDVLIPKCFREAHRRHVESFSLEPAKSRRMGERHPQILGVRKTGEQFPAEAAISKVEVAGGRLLTVILRDVSERRRTEESLRISEERFRVAVMASPAVVFNQDLQLRYTWIHNPKSPFAAEQVLGKTDFELLPQAEAEELTRVKRGVVESGAGARAVMRVTIGSEVFYYDLTVEPLRDASGRVVGITCASWDVTEQRRIENEQRFLADFGAALMVAAPDYEAPLLELARLAVRELADWFVVDIVGEAGQVRRLKVACSDPAKQELAAALEAMALDRQRPHLMREALECRRATLVSDAAPEFLESVAQNAEHLRLLRGLGMRSFIAVPLVARGRMLGALALIASRGSHRYGQRDLRFAEELARVAALAVDNAQLYQLKQRAIAARDDILGIVAHDLRNPLNSLLMQAQLLRRGGEEVERRSQKPIDAILRAGRRMDRLIEDMLDVARLEGGSLTIEGAAVAPRGLLDEALDAQRDAASRRGLHVRLDVMEPLPEVFVDRDRLLQVLDNLISNAIKFTGAGGDIVIGATPRAGDVLVWVADTGSGIPQEQLPYLFDRFWQAKKADRRGAGLGLAIVKGIIGAHGGRIWAESQIERGTTFYFTVPLASSPKVRPTQSLSPRASAGPG